MDRSKYTPAGRHIQPHRSAWYARRMTTKTLVESWLAAEYAAGKNKTEATAELNKATGMRYTLHRVLEWEKSEREVPARPRNHMIRVALRQVLETGGVDVERLSAAEIRKLADRLS
jgi:hypothetical protein